MPFSNPVAGSSGTLVRNQLQSQNFVTGISGWAIFKNGNVEFNGGTFRSTLIVGTVPGQHIIVDPVTDAILVYNASNQLIASITPTSQTIGGVAVKSGFASYDPVNPTSYVRIVGTQLQVVDNTNTPTAGASLVQSNNQVGNGGRVVLVVLSGTINAQRQSALQLISQSGDGTIAEFIQATQANVTGKMVQNDNTGGPALIHATTLSFTTDAFGNAVLTHGAGFTPTQGWLASNQGAGLWQMYAFSSAFTSTTVNANFKLPAGGNYASAAGTAFGIFIG